MWNAEIMKCLVQFSAPRCSVFFSSRFNPLQAKRRRRREETGREGGGGALENRNIYCSESPQAVPARPSGKCWLKARANVDK